MKKYQYLASWDDQTLTRVGEPVVVLGDSNVSQVEVTLPSDFLLDPTKAECRMYFLLPGEKESAHDVLETAVKDENGDSHVTWTIKHVHSQKGGRLAFSLTIIGDDAQWDSRTAIIPVYESRYQPESEEAEEPYTGRLDALEGSMASIRGEFAEVQDDFEELKETATLGTPIPESLVANMQEGRVYIYTGTEPGYTAGHVYYYVNGTLTDGGQYGGTAVDTTLTQSGQAADAKVTGDKIEEIKEDLNTFVTQEKRVDFSTLTPLRVSINTNYNWNPASGGNLASSYIFQLPNYANKIIVMAEERNAQISFLKSYPEKFSGAVDGYGLVMVSPGETMTLNIPDEASYLYVRKTLLDGTDITGTIIIKYDIFVTSDKYDAEKAIIDYHALGHKNYSQYRGTNETGEFSFQSVKRGNNIKFRCNFSILGEMTVGYKNINNTFSTYVIIDADNIRIRVPNVTEISTPHGLTLTNECTVTIYNDIEKIYITLESGGTTYTYNRVWTAGYLKPAYSLTGTTFTSVDFTFSNVDINHDIWMFGDSYFSFGDNRWVYYLITENNSNNCMIDAYAGEGSDRAINSFDYLTSIATPKYLVWALGMNDGSDENNPDTTWKTCLDHVLEVCKEKGITPVLCTIPTVSIKNHEKKNEYVRNSGHIYIDFAQAVGADANGNWYSGMSSSDGVHPTEAGAKTLYQQALTDFPVLTYK